MAPDDPLKIGDIVVWTDEQDKYGKVTKIIPDEAHGARIEAIWSSVLDRNYQNHFGWMPKKDLTVLVYV